MTIEEMRVLLKKCLEEAEPTLNVLGPIEEYRGGSTQQASRSLDGSLDKIDEKEMRLTISELLLELASQKHGFRMSEPDPQLMRADPTAVTVQQGNLAMSFRSKADPSELKMTTQIKCWYYSV
jgi:hypothetical protein